MKSQEESLFCRQFTSKSESFYHNIQQTLYEFHAKSKKIKNKMQSQIWLPKLFTPEEGAFGLALILVVTKGQKTIELYLIAVYNTKLDP